MGNSQTKGQLKGRQKKQVHWKAAERPSPPGKPQLVPGAEVTPDVVTIRWDKPKSDGGSPITGYLVEHRRTGSPHWVRATPILVLVPELTLSGLEPGWRYQFRVTAKNMVGMSDPGEVSEPLTVTLQRSVIAAPKFTEELQETTALENEMAEFIVHVIGQPPPKVCWFKDGFEIFSSRRTRIITENDKSVLTIHQVSLADEGEIKCTATNKAGHASTKSNVKVEAPPIIRLPRNYEEGLLFELDEVMRLKVSIAGRPQPLVFWTHNGESLQNSERYEVTDTDKSSVLKVGEAKRSDRGEYQIRAVNKLGEDSTSFLVTVTDKPQRPKTLRVVMSLGKTVTLSWAEPDDDGGCKIGNYIVEYYRIGWNVWLKAAACRYLNTTLSDLIEGSEYKFRVKAESPYGVSDPSDETDVIFIPDPKRGLLAPPPRTKSLTRESQREFAPQRETSPVAPKRRSTSSTRNSTREHSTLIPPNTIPTPPKRDRIRSPQKSPESSPMAARRYLTGDRSSLARELSYGSPEVKYKKPDVKPPPVPQHAPRVVSPIVPAVAVSQVKYLDPKYDEPPKPTRPLQQISKTPEPINKTPEQLRKSPLPMKKPTEPINKNLEPTNKTPSPNMQRERSPSIFNQLLSNILPRKSPTPSPSPSPPKESKLNIVSPKPNNNISKEKEKVPPPAPPAPPAPQEEIIRIDSMKGDRLDRLSPNISTRRLSSPMLDRKDRSPSPMNINQRGRSPSLVDSMLEGSPSRLSPSQRSKSPSPNPQPIPQLNRSQSPARYDDSSRRGSLQSYHNNNDMAHSSSEFMLVLVDDQDGASQELLMFEQGLIAPPLSLSAPELGAESNIFAPLKTSASSSELLHERAYARFFKDAEDAKRPRAPSPDTISLGGKGSFEKKHFLKIGETEERRPSVPKITINSQDDEETTVGLERKQSFNRRLSTGGANMAQQYLWAKRRHSLRGNPLELDGADLADVKNKFGDKLPEIPKELSIYEEDEEQEQKDFKNKVAESQNIMSQEKFEESIYSEDESESDDERSKAETIPPNILPTEEDTYHPRMMMLPSVPSKYEEPFEILTKPTSLPDPNFIPKPILKRKEENKKSKLFSFNRRSLSPSPSPTSNRQDRSRTPSPAPLEKKRSLEKKLSPTPSPTPSPIPGRRVSEAQMISAAQAAQKKRMIRQTSEEEAKVVADHYMDLVREYGSNRRPMTPTYLHREELLKSSSEELKKSEENLPVLPKEESVPITEITTRRETGRTTNRTTNRSRNTSNTRNTSGTRNTSATRNTNSTRNTSSTRATKRNPSPCPVTRRPIQTPEPPITDNNKTLSIPKTRSRSTSRTRTNKDNHVLLRTATPTTLHNKLMEISRTPSPVRPLTPEQEAFQAEVDIKVRTTMEYLTDLAMFAVAFWLYLFKDARLAIPILIIMVYRQLKDEMKNFVPSWMLKEKKN